ncbi:ATP-dependent metalloprotease FtsH [Gottschalkia purinilytica]|uniref:ATP-dependent zinc metalloprotease FtsH n=1 Tax=Gottschalkia purinilytica TaxID=1503 RepID=A0A0L0W7S0_GOTPU|nr:ATP-dependent zinc metalloprotease FtsH [Gottschalkia purinilytica]KNF07481.1 ATP-dependent metalloprotease FtsH [Gottschalkia purinilytica]
MKKNIILVLVIFSTIFSSFVFYNTYFAETNVYNFNSFDRTIVWAITLGLFIYYLKLDSRLSLAPASINSERKKTTETLNEKDKSDISFKDVAGLHEVKDELQEIIDFINNSEKYVKMGAKVPNGILFHGPPGTGKTLLAKAVAGETNSTFLYSSGSEFVEKYVGVGAKRVRSLFERAKKESPTIIFIDEIDAIGSKRNSDSNNEKDQTLNQLLVEMDGFHKSSTIIVIGATNRLDLLDEALLRPGRFDRHIYVGNPNIKSRTEILSVHTKNKPVDSSVNINDLAKKTHGFSGAQLANIANEAAIIAVRNKKKLIGIDEFNSAIERVVAGLEVKNPSVLDKEKNIVAYHEAGHALVGKLLNVDMIQKISIIPRGQALGYVIKLPDEERYLLTEKELCNRIKVLLGGRASEQVIFNEVTTGAKDDLLKATEIALDMVCSYGMSSLGNVAIQNQFIKYSFEKIDCEVKKIINACYKETLKIIQENKDLIAYVANYLIQNEVLTGEELDTLIEEFNNIDKMANIS